VQADGECTLATTAAPPTYATLIATQLSNVFLNALSEEAEATGRCLAYELTAIYELANNHSYIPRQSQSIHLYIRHLFVLDCL
jgi:hypothetical protein